MNIHRRSLLLALAALTFAGCASKPELSRIQDSNVDLRVYRSFAFFPGRSSGYPSLVEKRLVAATRAQLEHRGFVYDEAEPEILVNIAAVVEDRQALRKTPGLLPGSDGTGNDDYHVGRLAIDLFDARQRDIVWHGAASGRLSRSMLLDTGAAAEQAVAAIFDGFPTRATPASAPLAQPAKRTPAAAIARTSA